MKVKWASLKTVYLLLAVVIAAQLVWTGFVFFFQKDGCHSDEIWSYGLANSGGQPFVFQRAGVSLDEGTDEDLINVHEWIGGSVLHDYVTVQSRERFDYGAVWSNQTYDHHPPLYYLLLHTVCSFFPDSFSFSYGFFLNCIFLAVTQLFLFWSARLILKSEPLALITCTLYAAGHAALYTFTFIRQYALLTALASALVFFTAKLCSGGSLKKYLAPTLAVEFLMFMTHYYGIVYAGVLIGCVCVYLLTSGSRGRMLTVGFSSAGTLLLFFAVYPAAFGHITNYNTFADKPAGTVGQFGVLAGYIASEQFGIGAVLPAVLVVCAAAVCILATKKSRLSAWLRSADHMPLFLVAAAAAVCAVAAWKTDLSAMGEYSLRYIFCVFPGVCSAAVSLTSRIVSSIPGAVRKTVPVCGALCAAAVIAGLFRENLFLMRNYPDDIDPAQLTSGKVCAAVLDSEWELTCLCNVCADCESLFATTEASFAGDLPKLTSGKPEYILIKSVSLTPAERQMLEAAGMSEELPPPSAEVDEVFGELCAGRGRELEGCLSIANGHYYLFRIP